MRGVALVMMVSTLQYKIFASKRTGYICGGGLSIIRAQTVIT
jgi:hypothetical protein